MIPSHGQPPPTRWQLEMVDESWTDYRQRFASMLESGADLEGEARLLDAMMPRHADVLDAGCGTGRVTNALHRMGHQAVGVDRDAGLVAAGRQWYPGVSYLISDLLTLDAGLLREAGAPDSFDLIALPGNVMVFVAPGTERGVLNNLAGFLKPGGRIVLGFATDRHYGVRDLDDDAAALGLVTEHRFSTWDLAPWRPDASWVVTVLRYP